MPDALVLSSRQAQPGLHRAVLNVTEPAHAWEGSVGGRGRDTTLPSVSAWGPLRVEPADTLFLFWCPIEIRFVWYTFEVLLLLYEVYTCRC